MAAGKSPWYRRVRRIAGSPRPNADESGVTLVEILISVWLIGAVMVTMMGALFTMTGASTVAARTTALEVELRRYAEYVRTATYLRCAGQIPGTLYSAGYVPADAQIVKVAEGQVVNGVTPVSNEVRFWRQASATDFTMNTDVASANSPGGFPTLASLQATGLCDSDPANSGYGIDNGVQLVTIAVADTGTPPLVLNTSVLKRNH